MGIARRVFSFHINYWVKNQIQLILFQTCSKYGTEKITNF